MAHTVYTISIQYIAYIHMYYMAWAAIKITRCLSIFGTPTRCGFPLQSPAIELNFLLLIIIQNLPTKSATTKSTQKNVTSTGEINFREGFVVASRFSFNRVSGFDSFRAQAAFRFSVKLIRLCLPRASCLGGSSAHLRNSTTTKNIFDSFQFCSALNPPNNEYTRIVSYVFSHLRPSVYL